LSVAQVRLRYSAERLIALGDPAVRGIAVTYPGGSQTKRHF